MLPGQLTCSCLQTHLRPTNARNTSILHTLDRCLSLSSTVPGAFHHDPFAHPLIMTSGLPSTGTYDRDTVDVLGSDAPAASAASRERAKRRGVRWIRGWVRRYGGGNAPVEVSLPHVDESAETH